MIRPIDPTLLLMIRTPHGRRSAIDLRPVYRR
jgi:hypothetical protein